MVILEVLNEPAGREVIEPLGRDRRGLPPLKKRKKLDPTVVIFDVLNDPAGREVREPLELKPLKK